MDKYFLVVVWTAGTKDYIAPRLKETGILFKIHALLTQSNCAVINNTYIKDLKLLENKHIDINDILIVDDYKPFCALNLENRIDVKPFYGS